MSDYGEFVLKQSLYMAASAISTYSTWGFAASYLSKEKDADFSSLVTEDLIFLFFFSLIVGAVVPVFVEINFGILFFYLLAAFFFNNGLSVGGLRAEEKYGMLSFLQIVNFLSKFFLIIVFCIVENVLDPFFVFAAVDFVVYGFAYFYLLFKRKFKPRLKLSLNRQWKNSQYLATVADLPVQQVDRVILSVFLSSEALGVYALVRRVSLAFSQVVEPISHIFLNRVSRQKLSDVKKDDCLMSSFFVFLLGLSVVFFFYMFYPFVVNYISVLESYRGGGYFYFMMTVCVLSSSFFWVNMLAVAFDKKYKYLKDVVVSNVVFVCLLPVFAYVAGIGGAILAVAIQQGVIIVSRLVYVWPFLRGRYGA
tara:strand:- start:4065 stop:5159 length:1095 start_codon:yes stop_codon:yes gene_type:complete